MSLRLQKIPPAVSHSCFCCVSVGTLIPVLVTLPASAMCPLPIADVLPTNTAASAAIATSTAGVLLLFIILLISWFIPQRLSFHYAISTMLHIKC